jgi:codanin-1
MQLQSKEKPKKRVMPITVCRKASATNFISSSFQSENNLLTVTSVEVDDSVVDVIPEREMLREHRDAITRDFGSEKKPLRNLHALIRENLQSTPSSMGSPMHKSSTLTLVEYDESRVERREMLQAMAKLYSFIIDMNHVPNILSEFSYLVNLLNTEHNPYEKQQHQQQNYHQKSSSCDIASHLLKNFHNCIFFATCVLNHQKQTLAMLDCTTIRVLCDCERIQKLAASLCEYLRNVMQKKMQMDTLARSKGVGSGRGGNANSINKVVFYQQETDNRDNFPSDREFGAFKKQRDLFYGILR